MTPVIWAIGHWAAEWTFGDPAEEDCGGRSLMWRLHQHAIAARLPRQRTIVHLTLTGAGAAEGWLDIQRGAVTVCTDDPGYDVDLAIEADTGQMQRWLAGLVPFRDLIANGHARLLGQAWRAGRRRRYRPWAEPGMWLQWDWGQGPRIGGRAVDTAVLRVAGWSPFRVVIPVWDQQLGALTWCLDQALRAAGGAPAYLLTASSCSCWRR